MTQNEVVEAARIVAAHLEDEESQRLELEAAGFDVGQAHRLAALLPLAFARPILEELGVTHFSPTISVRTEAGEWLAFRLDNQPEYVAALALARRHRRWGSMPHEIYKLVAGSSSDIVSASKALNAGEALAGSSVAHALAGPDCAPFLLGAGVPATIA